MTAQSDTATLAALVSGLAQAPVFVPNLTLSRVHRARRVPLQGAPPPAAAARAH